MALALPAGASADALGANSEFFAPTAPTFPTTLVEGSDGNMWFTDPGFPPTYTNLKIGSVTPSGEVNEYSPGLSGSAWGISKGPESTVWFTEPAAKKVGHVKLSPPATSLGECAVPGMSAEAVITLGPDGNLWVTLGTNGIARIEPPCTVTEYPTSTEGFNAGAKVCSITAGPDGNVWFGDCGTTKAVGKITPVGVVTEYSVVGGAGTNQPSSIALGSDNRLWFPASNAEDEHLGAITTAGAVSYHKTPVTPELASLSSLTAGPDGNIWATETFGRNEEQKVTITGTGGTYKLTFEGQTTGWTGTGNTTNSGTTAQKKTITGVSTTTGKIAKGELVTGTNIQAGSTVVKCTPSNCESPTSFEISKEATGIATGVSLSADLTTTGGSGASTQANVEEALGKLSTIGGTENVFVLASESNRLVSFEGKFTRTDVPLLTCDGTNLTGGTCSVATTQTSVANRLFRIRPSGKMKAFSLKGSTTLQSFTKANALASGPGGNVWYTSYEGPAAIGKFGTEGYDLTVTPEGTGTGTVVSSPAGIECGATCEAPFEKEKEVTLTASPAAGSAFTSWKKCDLGKVEGRKCTVKMSMAKTVGAKFSPVYDVTVKKTTGNTGLGSITGITCDAYCTSATGSIAVGKAVKLAPKASKGSTFTEWSSCPGTVVEVNKCEMTSAGTAEAKFTAIPRFELTVNKIGGGQGTVKSLPASINCALTCSTMSSLFEENVQVELTASVTALKGSSFGGWTGGTGTCTGMTNPCKTSPLTGSQSVTAEFK
jgi:hypothetical protein